MELYVSVDSSLNIIMNMLRYDVKFCAWPASPISVHEVWVSSSQTRWNGWITNLQRLNVLQRTCVQSHCTKV